jgi:protein TonB
MKGLSINHVAFGSAILLHLLFFAFTTGMKEKEPEPLEQIAIRFTSASERLELPPPSEQPIAETPKPHQPPAAEVPLQITAAPPAPVSESLKPSPPAPVPASPLLTAPQIAAQKASLVQVPSLQAPPARQAPAPSAAAQSPARSAAPVAPQPHLPVASSNDAGRSHQVKGAGGGATAAARLPDFLVVLRGMVENNREYPAMARQLGLQGTVMVRVSIRGDGSLAAVSVEGSSGHKALDKAALSAVRRSAPFKAPAGFGLGQVTVEIPIVYRLT